MSKHSFTQCMNCDKSPTIEARWAEGMGHVWFCDKHFNDWANTNNNEDNHPHKDDIDITRKLKYGIASKKWSEPYSKKEAEKILLTKQIDAFILKYKEGIPVGIPTKVKTTRGEYDAVRYKKIPIEQLIAKSTENFSLIGSYSSGGNDILIQSDGKVNQIIVNNEKIYESNNLGDTLNRYYHELKNVADSQNDNKDLALAIFGDMVIEQNRRIIPLLSQLGKLSEAKMLSKQWAQFGVVPFQEEKDTDTVVSRAIPAKEFAKKRNINIEQQPIIGGDVRHPGTADFGMRADVRKEIDAFIQKYEAGKEAEEHKYVKKIKGDEEAPEGTYVTESKGHTYAYPKEEWGVEPKEITVSQDNPILNKISNSFTNKGFELYEVGGKVRDELLGRESHDIDLATNAKTEDVKNMLNNLSIGTVYAVGERYGTIGVNTSDGNIEITTYRQDKYISGSRKPQVVFDNKLIIEDDLSRRDFTINSMAVDLISLTRYYQKLFGDDFYK